MKTKVDKKVNKVTKRINRELYNDEYKDRFWIRQVKKSKVDGMQYYMFEMIDNKNKERNMAINEWFWGGSDFLYTSLMLQMNNFIITSDFWKTMKEVEKASVKAVQTFATFGQTLNDSLVRG